MSDSEIDENVSRSQKIGALLDVAKFNSKFTALIVGLGLVAAIFEGVGLSFMLPTVELVQVEDPTSQADGLLGFFVTVYQTLGVPFTLGYVVVGVGTVMTIRYSLSFIVTWFRGALRNYYICDLQTRAFEDALDSKVEYYDEEGSDNILNVIIS